MKYWVFFMAHGIRIKVLLEINCITGKEVIETFAIGIIKVLLS